MKDRVPHIALFLFGFLLYANTLNHQYALDDKIVITHNEFTKQGFDGIDDILTTDAFRGFYKTETNYVSGGRYRPLAHLTFAVEQELFGRDPFMSHLINAFLYGWLGWLLFLVLTKLFPGQNSWTGLPFLASLLFLAHPLHTEVVANLKGRDEILTLLLSLAALWRVLFYHETGKVKHLLIASFMLFLALFAKENAIAFVAVIPLSVWFFTSTDLRSNLLSVVPLIAGATLYLIIRISVVGMPESGLSNQLMNDPFLEATGGQRLATIIYTLGLYLKLLVFPHPLTNDYYPYHIELVDWASMGVIAALIAHLGLVVIAVKLLAKKHIASFAILFYLGTLILVSNLIFPVGVFMGERFLFMPSLGFTLILAWGIRRLPTAAWLPMTGVIVLAFSAKTVLRNPAWENDQSLALTDVQVSSNSAKANMSAGLSLIAEASKQTDLSSKKQTVDQAIIHLNKALEIYPQYHQACVLKGNALLEIGHAKQALAEYENCLTQFPGFQDIKDNISYLAQQAIQNQNYPLSIKAYEALARVEPNETEHLKMLGEIYGRYLQQPQQAIKWLNAALQLDPKDTNAMQKIGATYATTGNHAAALDAFKQAYALEPNNAFIVLNLAVTYRDMGDAETAKQFFERAFQLDPSLRQNP
jgi:Flp pilus assembly protein TadD